MMRAHHARGQAMTEYLIILSTTVIVLIAGSAGDDAPIDQLISAIKSFYGAFSFAISLAD